MDTTYNSSEVEQPPEVCVLISVTQNATRFVLLVPLSIFVLYQTFQQWRRQHSFSTTSHSDIFTFHNAFMEMFWALGTVIFHLHYYANILSMYIAGNYFIYISYFGENFFHMLTCVERYLAVVHPVTYRGLKNNRGVRIRDLTIGCVWLLCFLISFVVILSDNTANVSSLLIIAGLSLVINSFCSVSVLCVLIRPKPGEGGGDRKHIDQSKLRAFYTIMAILGAIWLWFLPYFVSTALFRLTQRKDQCEVLSSVFWFNLPSSLVLPLLYLHRTGRLACCHRK